MFQTSANPPASFSQIFHSTRHRQGVCILAMLTWVASCDGRIHPKQQLLLDKWAEAVDDVEDLSVVEAAARLHRVEDLTLACRFLKENVDCGGKRLLAQLAITMAIQDGYLSVGENHLLQFLSDLLGLRARTFTKLFQQIAHRPFPQPGDPSSPQWWRRREQGTPAAPIPFEGLDDERADEDPIGAMTRITAYRVLGLDEGASRESVHLAYRHLAKVRHPDRFAPLGPAAVASADLAFKRLHEAYAVLSTG